MSISRASSFYHDIQDSLEKSLSGYDIPDNLVQEALNDLFDSVAIHVWSRDDVRHVAERQDKRLSRSDIDEILSTIERHVDCDLGITWQSIEIAVDDFYIDGDIE